MLTVKEASVKCQACPTTISTAIREGILPATKKKIGKTKPRYVIREIDLEKWDRERKIVQPKPKKENPGIAKCDLPVGKRVKYNANDGPRSSVNMVEGTIIDKTERLIVIKNDLGFKECFSHFDYSQGAFKRA